MIHWLRNFKTGITNLIKWIPVIWKDRHWDYRYTLSILKHKLKLVEEFLRSPHAYSAEALKDADNIKHTIEILDKVLNPIREEPPKEFPDVEFIPSKSHPGYFEMVIDPEYREWLRESGEREKLEYSKNLDELFQFLRDHIEEWWD